MLHPPVQMLRLQPRQRPAPEKDPEQSDISHRLRKRQGRTENSYPKTGEASGQKTETIFKAKLDASTAECTRQRKIFFLILS